MIKYKNILYVIILCPILSNAYCIPLSCDAPILGAMFKQRMTLSDRLNDYRDVIKANTKQTDNQTLIIKQEVLAYRRLLERVKMETESLDKAVYMMNKIKKTAITEAINHQNK